MMLKYTNSKPNIQASACEACDRTHTPLHTPKTLETCKKKNMSCLIKKASKPLLSIYYKYLTRKSCVFVISLVQW